MSQKGSACSQNFKTHIHIFFWFQYWCYGNITCTLNSNSKMLCNSFLLLILPITWHVSMHTIFSAHSHWCRNNHNIHAINICLNIKTHLFHDSIIHGSELPTTVRCSVSSAHELFHDQPNVKQCVLVPWLNMLKRRICTWMLCPNIEKGIFFGLQLSRLWPLCTYDEHGQKFHWSHTGLFGIVDRCK